MRRHLKDYKCLLWETRHGVFDESGYQLDHLPGRLADNICALCANCRFRKISIERSGADSTEPDCDDDGISAELRAAYRENQALLRERCALQTKIIAFLEERCNSRRCEL